MNQIAYNLDQAAQAANVSKPTMRKLIHTDGFPAIRVGRRWVIPVEAFNAWLNKQAECRACFDNLPG